MRGREVRVDTAAISYRVADFLKKYPPFHAFQEDDLLDLSRKGRVKFFEPNQYVLAQGASRLQVLVIQQGTVSLWDERGREARLLDVRGAGDLVGIDQFNETRSYPYTARSESDVLVYAFPFEDFDALIQKYPEAEEYVSAYAGGSSDLGAGQQRPEPHSASLLEAAQKQFLSCDAETTIRQAAQQMTKSGADAIVVMDPEQRPRGVLTMSAFIKWIAESAGDSQSSVEALITAAPSAIGSDASIADAVLELSSSGGGALLVTSDGTLKGGVDAVVTQRSVGKIFGDRPVEIVQEISRADSVMSLRDLNERARAFILHYVANAASSDWLCRFATSVDTAIVRRVVALTAPEKARACWCFFGASGRGEALTKVAPQIALIVDEEEDSARFEEIYERVSQNLGQCGYLASGGPFESPFYAASTKEWQSRYAGWVSDPILKEIYRARPLFDLRPISGRRALWEELEARAMAAVNGEFLHVVANDCLATLPPLTFFHDAVLDETGGETAVFRLEESALRPLVDVGRVFGMAARKVFGTSTLERFAVSRSLLPQQAPIFEEASEALRIVLWQQGRGGIAQNSPGTELLPAQLRSYDRQMLRRSFRSISRLIEFTADMGWLKSL
jgi:CBS domain-containing protein